MSKLAATALGVVVLGSGATLTGGYMLGGFRYDVDLPRELTGTDEIEKQKLIFKEGCVKSLFSGVTNLGSNGIQNVDSTHKVESGFFDINPAKSSGCLVVNWDKEKTSDNSKWRGNFRFLWTLSTDSKGFVVFATGNTNRDNNASKMKFKGFAYALEKANNEGTINKQKVQDTEQDLEQAKFPKSGSATEKKIGSEGTWNFMVDESKICDSTNCASGLVKGDSFAGYWTWNGDTSKSTTVGDWSSNLFSDWGSVIFGSEWNMQAVVQNVKGEGTQKYPSPKPASAAKA